MYFLLKMWIFHGYVSLPEGTLNNQVFVSCSTNKFWRHHLCHLWTPLVNDCQSIFKVGGWGYDDQSIDCRPKLHFLLANFWRFETVEKQPRSWTMYTVNIVSLIHFPTKKALKPPPIPSGFNTNVADWRLKSPPQKWGKYLHRWQLVGGWTNPFEKVKLDHFPGVQTTT